MDIERKFEIWVDLATVEKLACLFENSLSCPSDPAPPHTSQGEHAQAGHVS